MAISLPDLLNRFKVWIQEEVRIDNFSLDVPTILATKIGNKYYPANTCVLLPPTEITFEESVFGLLCTATVRFEIKYRFTGKLEYDQLPMVAASGIINNVYYEAVLGKAAISTDILEITTPDVGTEILVTQVEPNTDSDWLVVLRPIFRVTFKVGKANLDDLQPGEDEEPIKINKLEIAIFNAYEGFDPKDPTTYNLDTYLRFDREE